MQLFLGTIANKIDKKGRVSVPAAFRTALSCQSFAGIVAFRSLHHDCIEGCGMSRLEDMNVRINTLEQYSPEHDELVTIFSDAQTLGFDSEGRVMLPPFLVSHAKITDTATFVGQGNTFQIWEPQAYQKHSDALRSQARAARRTLPARPLAPESHS